MVIEEIVPLLRIKHETRQWSICANLSW